MSEPTTPGDVIRCTAAEFEHYLSLNPPDPPRPDLHQLCQRAIRLADAVDKLARLLPFLKCPRDTNNDGDCGQPVCPFCGHGSVQTIKAEIEEVCRE